MTGPADETPKRGSDDEPRRAPRSRPRIRRVSCGARMPWHVVSSAPGDAGG